jgi:asparagine synthase (glutamine-hydrolysing)
MKVQMGLLYLDNRPTTQNDLEALLGEYSGATAETSGDYLAGPLLIAYRGDRITKEDDYETQPFQYGSYIVTFDGRLDNRDDLAGRLRVECGRMSDVHLVARAIHEYGEQIIREFIGEFALTACCKQNRTITFARSTCGVRPLYYLIESKKLVWSSDFAHLVHVSDAQLTVNEDYIFEYLLSLPNTTHTPLKMVKVVPPNTLMRIDRGVVVQEYELWHPEENQFNARSDEEYEECCREKVAEAVRVRLRAKHPIFSELSGGLDSSTIVLTADQVLRDRGDAPGTLKTISCVYEESKSCDESSFIRQVEKHRGAQSIYVREADLAVTLGLRQKQFTGLPNPLHCYPGRLSTYAAIMRAHSGSLLLSGSGGDHLFWSIPAGAPLIADHIRQGKFVEMHRECIRWSSFLASPYVSLLMAEALPRAFPKALSYEPNKPVIPSWIPERHRKRLARRRWDVEALQDRRFSASTNAQRHAVALLFSLLAAGHYQEYRSIFVSHPFTHRPLINFCLSVPLRQLVRDGQTRSLMRRAFRNLLPPRIANRKGKAGIDEAFVRAVRRDWDDIGDLRNWELHKRGLMNPEQLLPELDKARLGYCDGLALLIRVFSIERWLRSLSCVGKSSQMTNAEFTGVA